MDKAAINLIRGVKTLGFARKDMPQINDLRGFLKSLKKDGVSHEKAIISPYGLKPTQKSISSGKVDAFKDDVMNKPVVVAKGGNIVDGHHRWAKAVMDDKIDKLKIVKVDMPAKTLINKAHEYNLVKKAFLDELEKISLSKNKIINAVVHRIGDVQYAKSKKIFNEGFDVRKIQRDIDAVDSITDEAISYARSIGNSNSGKVKDLVRLTQKEFPKKIYMEKKSFLDELEKIAISKKTVKTIGHTGAAIATVAAGVHGYSALKKKKEYMEKKAFLDELEKVATIEALGKKRYWQIVKKLYGGTDSAMRRLSKNPDTGIYHGTDVASSKKISRSGLKASESMNPYKNGMPHEDVVFFGSKERSNQKNTGALFRLKKPNELKSGITYPRTDRFNGFDRRGQKISKKEHKYLDETASITYSGNIPSNIITKVSSLDKAALHPLMEMSMAGAEVGSLVGAAIAIPIHRPGKLKDSLLEKAEIGGVTGAALTPITATILKKMKVFKW